MTQRRIAGRASPGRASQSSGHDAHTPRRSGQGHRPGPVRRRHPASGPPPRQGLEEPPCPRPYQVHRHEPGPGPSRGEGGGHRRRAAPALGQGHRHGRGRPGQPQVPEQQLPSGGQGVVQGPPRGGGGGHQPSRGGGGAFTDRRGLRGAPTRDERAGRHERGRPPAPRPPHDHGRDQPPGWGPAGR